MWAASLSVTGIMAFLLSQDIQACWLPRTEGAPGSGNDACWILGGGDIEMLFHEYTDVREFYIDTYDVLMRNEAQNLTAIAKKSPVS